MESKFPVFFPVAQLKMDPKRRVLDLPSWQVLSLSTNRGIPPLNRYNRTKKILKF